MADRKKLPLAVVVAITVTAVFLLDLRTPLGTAGPAQGDEIPHPPAGPDRRGG